MESSMYRDTCYKGIGTAEGIVRRKFMGREEPIITTEGIGRAERIRTTEGIERAERTSWDCNWAKLRTSLDMKCPTKLKYQIKLLLWVVPNQTKPTQTKPNQTKPITKYKNSILY